MFSSSSPTSFLFQGSLEKKPEAATILLIQTRVSLHILTYNFEYIYIYMTKGRQEGVIEGKLRLLRTQ